MTSLFDGVSSSSIVRDDSDGALRHSSDAELCEAAVRALSVPRLEPASSFELHAPLELLARAALLPDAQGDAREVARQRIVSLAVRYREGTGIERPASARYDSPSAAVAELSGAVSSGDLGRVDAAASWLGDQVGIDELREILAPVVLPALGAAGHANLLFDLAGEGAAWLAPGRMLRSLARELGRRGNEAMDWHRQLPVGAQRVEPSILRDVLLRTPRLSKPERYSILAMIDPVRRADPKAGGESLAARLLGPCVRSTHPALAAREIQRVAALSMVQDDPAQSPYGWTHCLTLARAAADLQRCRAIDPDEAIAVAATYVLGIRGTLGARELDWSAAPVGHVHAEKWSTIVRMAAMHHDAHFVKYVVACRQSAAADPEYAQLYLQAAETLAAWWREHPVEDDPLVS